MEKSRGRTTSFRVNLRLFRVAFGGVRWKAVRKGKVQPAMMSVEESWTEVLPCKRKDSRY